VPRKKKATEAGRLIVDAAVGICGWALTIETLIVLQRRGMLRKKDTLRIIGGALEAVDQLSQHVGETPAFAVAVEMLAEQAAAWSKEVG
jgi:hypothetical protein